jgi:DHA2 family multidrug resistance protein
LMEDGFSPAAPGGPDGRGPAPAGGSPPPEAGPEDYKWKVLSTVVFGVFMIILDTTVVNVAFQTLREEFGGNLGATQWIISVYVLALGISTPLSGFLADRFGSKRVYLGGLGLFVLGSLLCGLAPSLGLLIAARAVQGIGGGIALPLGSALLLRAFPPKEQGTALGLFGIVVLVAPAVGPILGGWLVDEGRWRMIFFINPPIGLIGILLGMRFLREQENDRRFRFDLLGAVTEIIGFGAILYAASIAAEQGWTSPVTLTWFGVGAIGLICFALVELFQANPPLLDLRLFGNRIFLNATLLGYVSTLALFGAEFLMPVYLQALRGRTALETGFILLPMAISGGIFVTLAGRLYDKIGPRPLMAAGFSILMINTWQLSQIQANTTIPWIIFLLALRGMALGLTVQTTFVTALSVVDRRGLARGSSLVNATRLVVQSIGVAVLATVLASAISPEVRAMQEQFGERQQPSNGRFAGLCEPAATAPFARAAAGKGSAQGAAKIASLKGGVFAPVIQTQEPPAPPPAGLLERACEENIAGFERSYRLTFYAAFVALLLGLMLPGWPAKWSGRGAAEPPVGGH